MHASQAQYETHQPEWDDDVDDIELLSPRIDQEATHVAQQGDCVPQESEEDCHYVINGNEVCATSMTPYGFEEVDPTSLAGLFGQQVATICEIEFLDDDDMPATAMGTHTPFSCVNTSQSTHECCGSCWSEPRGYMPATSIDQVCRESSTLRSKQPGTATARRRHLPC